MNKRPKVIVVAAIVNLVLQGVLLSLSIEKGWQVYESRFWPFSGLYHETISDYTEDTSRIVNPTKTQDEIIFVKSAYELKDLLLQYDNRKIVRAILHTGSNIEAYQALTGTHKSDVFLESLERAWSRGVPISEIYDRLFENFLERRTTINSLDFSAPHVTAKQYFLLSNLRMSSLTEKDIERIFPIIIRSEFNWLMGYNRTEFLIYGLLLSTLLVSSTYLRTTDKSD